MKPSSGIHSPPSAIESILLGWGRNINQIASTVLFGAIHFFRHVVNFRFEIFLEDSSLKMWTTPETTIMKNYKVQQTKSTEQWKIWLIH